MPPAIEAGSAEAGAHCDIAIVGAGAAGLMAAIEAGRTSSRLGMKASIVALDSARVLGAKILVAGGGRCNVTHDVVDASAFAGSSRPAIRKILGRFDVGATARFFEEQGVRLKREETGKLFPVTDRSRTVLDALLRAASQAGARLVHPWRVEAIDRVGPRFVLRGGPRRLDAGRIVLAAGGKALPKSGSDGHGFELVRRLGHTTTPRIHAALVPLVLAPGCFVLELAGISVPARIELRSGSGRPSIAFTGSTLCTHTGLSGPPVLDISRYWIAAREEDPAAHLAVNWLPGLEPSTIVRALEAAGGPAPAWLRGRMPARLAEALCREARVDPALPIDRMPRASRDALGETVCAWRAPVVADRGFTHAEVTAGGVPLFEVKLETLESRACPGLHLAGEILDVDGRIGGFNFQWAWASGFVAGRAAAEAQASASRSGGSTPAASR
jgi:predicted Rossmann fold flavoprotein